MSTIVSPLPHSAPVYCDSVMVQPIHLSQYSFQDSFQDTNASRRVANSPQLLSPIKLAESRSRASSFKPQSPPPCSPPRRRRGPNTRISRRRRHCAPADRLDNFGAAIAFERLPWISVMESSPDQLNTWDMADLSQLPAEEFPSDASDVFGPGPVRRRKTSQRTNPLASSPEPPSGCAVMRTRMQSLTAAHLPSSPRTPVSQFFSPFEIHFHELLPVLPSRNPSNDQMRN